MAHAAQVMALFSAELGREQDIPRWRQLEANYRQRTRQLFDATQGRYKDWLVQEGTPQYPRPDLSYWGVDSCRWSPLGLTPLLIGEPLDDDELWRHAAPPWTLWPSWTYALAESAAAGGHVVRTGEVAAQIIDRVYRTTTRRHLGSRGKPVPGTSPEFWPEDWRTYQGHDAYGWGATTANLLLRHVFGFKESRITDHLCFELTPALPPWLLEPGRRLGVRNLNYRGLVFDLDYVVSSAGLSVELDLGAVEKRCNVGHYDSQRPTARHGFPVEAGQSYRVDLS